MKSTLLLALSALFVLHCNAQITINGFHNFDAGTSATFTFNQTEQDLLNDGEDQVWDMSAITGQTFTNEYISSFDTPFSFNYPAANVALSSGGFYSYYEATPEGLVNHGFVLQEILSCVYSDPLVQAEYPMTYLDSISDDFAGELTLLADETVFTRVGQVQVKADAHGDLILPFDTIENTLRLKTFITVTDSLDGQAFTGTETTYIWFDAEYGSSLASYSILENIGQPTQYTVAFISQEDYLSVKEEFLRSELTVYPNPSSDFIQINGINESTDYRIVNQQGQEVLSGKAKENEQISIHELSAGIYFVEIRKGNAVRMEKLLVE